MRKLMLSLLALFTVNGIVDAQTTALEPGLTIQKKLLKNQKHIYSFDLKKGEYATLTLMQKGVDAAIDVSDPSGKKIRTFDSPNGVNGPEPVEIIALANGKYQVLVYTFNETATDSTRADQNQGDYSISEIKKLSVAEYKQKQFQALEDKKSFAAWMKNNSHEIKTVEAGNGFEDLQPFKAILKGVRVVGSGESSHGTAEFFKMKHRMLEFLIKEMDFHSFYLEASMARCRYINDYVLYGKGNLDTATAIQGFITWRTEEVRDMIEWLRNYNKTVADNKKVKFLGYDLQINDRSWAGLKTFYATVDPSELLKLDTLQRNSESAAFFANSGRQAEALDLFKKLQVDCPAIMSDIVLNDGKYEFIAGKDLYEENLMNIKLIVQEIESYKDGYNNQRDYYMAQNIITLLNNEAPDAKVVVWAHNGHIAKDPGLPTMGYELSRTLKELYYAVGFEFYAGSFQTRNMDSAKGWSANWDIMSAGVPPVESLPWYFNNTGKTKLFIDFRNTGTDKLVIFSNSFQVHSFGSMLSSKWPQLSVTHLTNYDGMIYIKESHAAKNFSKVTLWD